MYISITGLKLKTSFKIFLFLRHAIPSFMQSKKSTGNISSDTKTKDGIRYTLSVWDSKEAMLAFKNSGAHKMAMKAFPRIATGKTFGYESDTVPDWDEAMALLEEKGIFYGR